MGRARSNFGTLAEKGFRRATICISSQVGCAVNCQFCLTAKLGIRRNLTAGEIAGQVAAVLNRHKIQIGKDRINLVFMGMGEPFLNYENFMKSVRLLVEAMGIPESRMTVSTSGILPGIVAFAGERLRPKLALSLNASNDIVRERIMPITRKWNIAELLEAVVKIPLRTREWVTFEYVLLGGVNDQPEHAREVLALLRGMRAKVNLIVWNPGPGIDYVQPTPADVAVFQKMLIDGGIATYIRRPRGRDIYAACGQLKRTVADESKDLVAIRAAADLERRVEAAVEKVFHLRPLGADDGEPRAVAVGAVRHEHVAAEGAFVDSSDGLDGGLRAVVVGVGLESDADKVERLEGVGEL